MACGAPHMPPRRHPPPDEVPRIQTRQAHPVSPPGTGSGRPPPGAPFTSSHPMTAASRVTRQSSVRPAYSQLPSASQAMSSNSHVALSVPVYPALTAPRSAYSLPVPSSARASQSRRLPAVHPTALSPRGPATADSSDDSEGGPPPPPPPQRPPPHSVVTRVHETEACHAARLQAIDDYLKIHQQSNGLVDAHYEASQYELWFMTLAWLRLLTCFNVHIGPQARVVYARVTDSNDVTIEMTREEVLGNLGSNRTQPKPKGRRRLEPKVNSTVPDFVLYDLHYVEGNRTSLVRQRKMIAVIEIKVPADVQDDAPFKDAVVQALIQARYAFGADENLEIVHCWAACGTEWLCKIVRRHQERLMPKHKNRSKWPSDVLEFVNRQLLSLARQPLLESVGTDFGYSRSFREQWRAMCDIHGVMHHLPVGW